MRDLSYTLTPLGGVTAMQALVVPLVFAWILGAQPVVPPIAPPKPAVARAANALVISTGDLNSSVNWARQGRLADATTSFNLFKDDWNVVDDDVRQQSTDVADQVDAAIAQVDDLLANTEALDP